MSCGANFEIGMVNKPGRVFTGYLVRPDDTCGPAKGGIRFHPDVDLTAVKALAFRMTCKWTVLGIPYGGAKTGVIVDPK